MSNYTGLKDYKNKKYYIDTNKNNELIFGREHRPCTPEMIDKAIEIIKEHKESLKLEFDAFKGSLNGVSKPKESPENKGLDLFSVCMWSVMAFGIGIAIGYSI